MAPKLTLSELQSRTGIPLSGDWHERDLLLLSEVLERYQQAGITLPFASPAAPGTPAPLSIHLENKGKNCLRDGKTICFNSSGLTAWTVTHEFAHGWDAANGWRFSKQMAKATRSGFLFPRLHLWRPPWKVFWYRVGSPPPPCGVDKHFNAIEDFAESVTAFLYPEEAARRATQRGYPYEKWGYAHYHDTPRGKFVKLLIEK